MRKRSVMGILMTLMMVFMISPVYATNQPVVADNMHVSMDVQENGEVDVKVVLDVNFNEPRQGVFVSIPQTYKDMMFDGVKRDYFFPVSNIRVKGENVETETNRQGVVLKIGEAGTYLTGAKRYEYAYTIGLRDLRLGGQQALYLNLIGQDWQFPILKSSFDITMPKAFDKKPYFYATQAELPVDFQVMGNQITGSFNQPLIQQALTIKLDLPNGYFTFPSFDYTNVTVGLSVFIAILSIIGYVYFGREYLSVETVEFDAPDGLSSAEIGYIYRGAPRANDIVSLIIYWASKGYLTIEELETKDSIKLHKIKDLPGMVNTEEQRVFLELFNKRDAVTTQELNNTFGTVVQYAVAHLPDRFRDDYTLRVFDRTSSFIKGILGIVIPLGIAVFVGSVGIIQSGYINDFFRNFGVSLVVYGLLTGFSMYALNVDGINGGTSKWRVVCYGVMALVAAMTFLLIGEAVVWWKVALVLIAYFISVHAAANTSRRTQQGAIWYGQIKGLKNFIQVAEHDRLVMLVQDTPELFYNILPYAYVLGVTDVWMKKFESIAIVQPDWYQSQSMSTNFNSLILWSALNSSVRTISNSMVSIPAPKGSSGGGGSFGGGGGGFSGGGFGGGGGGSW